MSYMFLKTASGSDATGTQNYLSSYLMAVGLTQACLCLSTFIVARFFSNRVAGPIYALKRFITMTLDGHSSAFKLREKDEFRELEGPMTKLNEMAHFAAPTYEEVPPLLTLIQDEKEESVEELPPPHEHLKVA